MIEQCGTQIADNLLSRRKMKGNTMPRGKPLQIVNGKKECTKCHVFKQVFDDQGNRIYTNFYRHSKNSNRWQSWCIKCKVTHFATLPKSAKTVSNGNGKHNGTVAASMPVAPAVTPTAVAPVAATPVVNNVQPVQRRYQFIEVDGMLVNIDDISAIEVADSKTIDVVMKSTEMSKQGYVHSRVYRFSGVERDLVLASIQIVSGQEPKRLIDRIAELEATNKQLVDQNLQLVADRDAAIQLAAELEAKRNQLKALL